MTYLPDLHGMKLATEANNTQTQFLNSIENCQNAAMKAADIQLMNQKRAELASVSICALTKSLFVYAPPPLDLLPPKIRRIIEEVAARFGMGWDVVMAILLALIFIAARGSLKVRVSTHHQELVVAYIVVALESGQRKSALVAFFRAMLEKLEAEWAPAHQHEASEATRAVLEMVAARRKAKLARRFDQLLDACGDPRRTGSLLSEDLTAIRHIEQALKDCEFRRRLLIGAATPQALETVMAAQGEVIGVLEAEGGFLKCLDAKRLDLLLKAHTGERFTSDTKTAGSVSLECPAMNVFAAVQPNVLQWFYGNEEFVNRGLAPRLLPLHAPPLIGMPGGGGADIAADVIEDCEALLRGILRMTGPAPDGARRTIHTLDLSPEAKAEIDRYGQEINAQRCWGHFDWSEAFAGKLVGHAVRLAAAVWLMKGPLPLEQPIDRDSILCGIALAEFFRQHAALAFRSEALDGVACAPKILRWMAREGVSHFVERAAHRAIGSGRHTIDQVRAGIDVLERHNYLRRVITWRKGSVCVVHPFAYVSR